MKSIFLAIMLAPSLSLLGQDSSRVLSKYEKFISATGIMYKTETKDLSKIKDITISLVKTTNLSNNKSAVAVLIFQKNTFMFTPISLGVIYIDIDEIEGVASALTYYQAQVKGVKPKNEPSFTYITTNDILVSCSYIESGFSGWFVSLSQRYHYSRLTVPNSIITIKNKDIDDLAESISKAKTESQTW